MSYSTENTPCEGTGMFKVFFSWQSDLSANKTSRFIRECIDLAIEFVQDVETIEAERDEATSGLTGSPDIVQSILKKIDECELFITDISQCFKIDSQNVKEDADLTKVSPNPNVLFELGYAVKSLSWARIICLVNTEYGNVTDLPFDIAQQRVTSFQFTEKNRDAEKLKIAKIIAQNIQTLRMKPPVEKEGKSSHLIGYYDFESKSVVHGKYEICDVSKQDGLKQRKEQAIKNAKNLVEGIQSVTSEMIQQRKEEEQRKQEEEAAVKAAIESAYENSEESDKALEKYLSDITTFEARINQEAINISDLNKSFPLVQLKNRELIEKALLKYLDYSAKESFFDLGDLRSVPDFGSLSPSRKAEGTEIEKKKYKLIKELESELRNIFCLHEFPKLFEKMYFIPVAIKNQSSVEDSNLRIVISIRNGEAVKPSKALLENLFRGFEDYICDQDDEKGLVYELFQLFTDDYISMEYHPQLEPVSYPSRPFPITDPFFTPAKDEDDIEDEMQEYIATPLQSDFYEFKLDNLRPGECKWVGQGMLIKPSEEEVCLKYKIYSSKLGKSIDGELHLSKHV